MDEIVEIDGVRVRMAKVAFQQAYVWTSNPRLFMTKAELIEETKAKLSKSQRRRRAAERERTWESWPTP
jgi:hypothetical protein